MNDLLEIISKAIELAPNEIEEAYSKKRGLENYLTNNKFNGRVYMQGSFSYGTPIKPLRKDRDGDFDLDIVFEIEDNFNDAKDLKESVGLLLKSSKQYSRFMEKEGKRCWTLDYENFHIDILPAIPDNSRGDTFIKITNKDKSSGRYIYKSSNPMGLTEWFLNINEKHYKNSFDNRKSLVFGGNKQFFTESMNYRDWKEVDNKFITTPIQNVVMLLKRHRDQMYVNTTEEEYKPISVIITVLVGKVMENKPNNIYEVLEVMEFFTTEYRNHIEGENNSYKILNPVDARENLADKWNEDNKRFREFQRWLESVKTFLDEINNGKEVSKVISKYFGTEVNSKVQSIIDKEKNDGFSKVKPTSKPWGNNGY